MSTSTDGLLVFGFDLGIEDEPPLPHLLGDDDTIDFDEFIAREAGMEEWTPAKPTDYWDRHKAFIDACPVDLVRHCSGEYPMFLLIVRGTEHRAWRGSPKVLAAEDLVVSAEKIEAARKWCEAHQVEWREPSWVLASMWS